MKIPGLEVRTRYTGTVLLTLSRIQRPSLANRAGRSPKRTGSPSQAADEPSASVSGVGVPSDDIEGVYLGCCDRRSGGVSYIPGRGCHVGISLVGQAMSLPKKAMLFPEMLHDPNPILSLQFQRRPSYHLSSSFRR